MKKIIFCLLTSFLLSACTSEPQPNVFPVIENETFERSDLLWITTDFQDRETGNEIPDWVNAWLEGGNSSVEALNEFQDRFVFVAVNRGNNFSSLKQWQDNFSTELDFARLAAVRIENRFALPLTSYPDNAYGAFFEMVIKAASDMVWNGAVRENDFWIKQESTGPEPDAEYAPENAVLENEPLLSEVYVFLILVTVERPVLIPQLSSLLRSINPEPPLTREQNSAVNRVQRTFLDGF